MKKYGTRKDPAIHFYGTRYIPGVTRKEDIKDSKKPVPGQGAAAQKDSKKKGASRQIPKEMTSKTQTKHNGSEKKNDNQDKA